VGDGDVAFSRIVETLYQLIKRPLLSEQLQSHTLATSSSEVPLHTPMSNNSSHHAHLHKKLSSNNISSKLEPLDHNMFELDGSPGLLHRRKSFQLSNSSAGGDIYNLSSSSMKSPHASSSSSDAAGATTSGITLMLSSTSSSKLNIHRAQALDKELSMAGLEEENMKLRGEISQLRSELDSVKGNNDPATNQHSTAHSPSHAHHHHQQQQQRSNNKQEFLVVVAELERVKGDLQSMNAKNKSLKSKITQVKEEVDSLERDKRVLQYENSLMKQEIVKVKEQLAHHVEHASLREKERK
jgi:hypothetical protein